MNKINVSPYITPEGHKHLLRSDPFVVIPRLGGCVVITLKYKFVILNEVKNLIRSMCCKTELRLGPQNDIATQSLDRGIENGHGCPLTNCGHDGQPYYMRPC